MKFFPYLSAVFALFFLMTGCAKFKGITIPQDYEANLPEKEHPVIV